MLFILNVSIGGGVWVPFTLGKSVALLTVSHHPLLSSQLTLFRYVS